MKLYTTVLPESKDLPKDFIEYFILPDSICEKSATEILGRIRSKTWGNWERLPRQVISIDKFDPKTFTYNDYVFDRFKYVSTESGEAGEQIFIFSKFVDHDAMYEAIQCFEEVGNEDPDFRARLGAGFTGFTKCFGRSETLRLDSREELDTALLVY